MLQRKWSMCASVWKKKDHQHKLQRVQGAKVRVQGAKVRTEGATVRTEGATVSKSVRDAATQLQPPSPHDQDQHSTMQQSLQLAYGFVRNSCAFTQDVFVGDNK